MFALCFEERILSHRAAVLKAGPPSAGARPGQSGCQEGRFSLAAFLGISFACSLPTVEGGFPNRRHRSPSGHFVHCRLSTWRKSICITVIIFWEGSLWSSVTFIRLEIILFLFLKLYKCMRK